MDNVRFELPLKKPQRITAGQRSRWVRQAAMWRNSTLPAVIRQRSTRSGQTARLKSKRPLTVYRIIIHIREQTPTGLWSWQKSFDKIQRRTSTGKTVFVRCFRMRSVFRRLLWAVLRGEGACAFHSGKNVQFRHPGAVAESHHRPCPAPAEILP